MDKEQSINQPSQKPTLEQALISLNAFGFWDERAHMERAFLSALQGDSVREIGRFQVYTDFQEM
jgi:hypothetical protein